MNIRDAHHVNTLIEWVLTTGRAGTATLSDDSAALAAAEHFERRAGKEGNGVKSAEGDHARNLVKWARTVGEVDGRPLHEDKATSWSAEYLAARAYMALTAGVRPKDIESALEADRRGRTREGAGMRNRPLEGGKQC